VGSTGSVNPDRAEIGSSGWVPAIPPDAVKWGCVRPEGSWSMLFGLETIRAYTDPGNTASQKVLLHCGRKKVGEIELLSPTHHGERRAPLFRISRTERSA